MKALPVCMARNEAEFGGKAVKLGEAVSAGLPVPPAYALDVEMVEAVHLGIEAARRAVVEAFTALGAPLSVRSSAVGEDSGEASFAGQHLTVLNVMTPEEAVASVIKVRNSAFTEAARAYRVKRGLQDKPRMAVVIQKLLNPDSAGVMFTRNPITGQDERLIEAAWGLGEAVVAGIVTPDAYRLDREGHILQIEVGEKHLALHPMPGGGICEERIDAGRAGAPVLSTAELTLLHGLAARCEEVYGRNLDIEWAIDAGHPYLLQSRAITTSGLGAAA